MSPYQIEKRSILLDEYQKLRRSTNWTAVSDNEVSRALKNDLFSVCVLHENSITGMGRVIGDGFIYFYIQDVIVIPEHRGKGVGRLIMEALINYLDKNAPSGAFIGLMAAEGTDGFYRNFDFQARSEKRPGMYKIQK